MGLYLQIAWFNGLHYFTYPMELAAAVAKRLIEVSFFMMFWAAVARSSNGTINTHELLGYVLIAGSAVNLTGGGSLNFTQVIHDAIKRGGLSNYLIKPLALIPHLYATFLGERSVKLLLSIPTMIAGLMLSPTPKTPENFMIFLGYMVLATLINTAFNVLIGVAGFYTPEAASIRHTFGHAMRVLSGMLVPLSFFPGLFRTIMLYSPFPVMAYGPASVFTPSTLTIAHSTALALALGWSIILWAIALAIWNFSLKRYDAVGI